MAYIVYKDGQQVGWQRFQYYSEAEEFRKQVIKESGLNAEHFAIKQV